MSFVQEHTNDDVQDELAGFLLEAPTVGALGDVRNSYRGVHERRGDELVFLNFGKRRNLLLRIQHLMLLRCVESCRFKKVVISDYYIESFPHNRNKKNNRMVKLLEEQEHIYF